ncbi:MAG: DUF1624 domain-containing protein [archaeon]|nr:MAG: DUF1624 domain-containing protein [archaeon]
MRFWEIDLLRGIAIVMMVFFHIFFDLKFFRLFYFESTLFWWVFPRVIASIFILLVGVSLSISYSRVSKKPRKEIAKKYVLRGLKIFSWGLIITTVTWFLVGHGFIFFGILHFIGLSIILSYPFLRYPRFNLYFALMAMLAGVYLAGFLFPFPHLMWLGFVQEGAYSLDYFPLLPWFGLVLLGIFYGNILYPQGKRDFRIRELNNRPEKFLSFLGKNSLLIYLLHQPLILGIIFLFS